MEGEGGGVEVVVMDAPGWEGGDPSMMSSESTVEGKADVRQRHRKLTGVKGHREGRQVYLRWTGSSAPRCRPSPAETQKQRFQLRADDTQQPRFMMCNTFQ